MPEFSNYVEGLDAATVTTGTILIPVSQNGDAKRFTPEQIVEAGGGSGGTSIPYGATSGTNTYTATMSPVVSAYTDGAMYHVRVGNNSTSLVTIDMGPGAKKVFDTAGVQAQDGYLKAGVDYVFAYNSSLDTAAGGFVIVNEIIHGLMNFRSVFGHGGAGLWPTGGGSGPAGGIRHGDTFVISGGAGVLGAKAINTGDFITTAVDAPGQNDSLWYVIPGPASIVGVQDLEWPASAMWPTITNGCSALTQVEMATSLINLITLDFDQTTQEFAQFRITPPRKWNNGTLSYKVEWSSTASSGTVVWGLQAVALGDGDSLTTAFGTAVEVSDAVASTNSRRYTAASGALTVGNTPADGDLVYFQVYRDPADASDDLAADARLHAITIYWTMDAAIDA